MNKLQTQADIFKALGHPVRLQMIEALSRGDRCVNDFRPLARIFQANVSRHLARLKRTGLVTERRAGPRVIHRLACREILSVLACAETVTPALKKRRNAES